MNTTANLGKAPVRTLVLQLSIPSMTAQFVNVLYSIIDRMYIGHISENGALALAGAGICGPIVTLLTSFGTLVGIGGSITMGIRMGEKNHKKAEQVLANSFLMLSIFSVLLTVSFLLLKDKLLMLFGASGAPEIWWCFPGRYADHLCHHCSKLSASDHLTYDRDQRRYTGNPELQLRCQMRKQGQGRRKEHSGSNAYLYHHHVPSLPVYSPVLCSSVYH